MICGNHCIYDAKKTRLNRARERERFPAPISNGSGAGDRSRSGARSSLGVISSEHTRASGLE